MPLIINTNISALNAQRQLVKSGDEMSQAMERLSSGKRINTAADDAAGMAISSRMTSTIRGLNQAVRNANDGISLIQTAGGALEESTNILQRMRELSIQSANGIYTDANRTSLNAEVQQLKQELTRIATTTSFNGLKILDGTLGDIDLQIGTEANETITLKVGSGFDAESLGATESGVSSGSFTLAQSTSAGQSGPSGTLTGLGLNDMVINGIDIPAASGTADTVSSSDNTASALAIAAAINSVSDETGVVAEANATSVSFTMAGTFGSTGLGAGDLVINGIDLADASGITNSNAGLVQHINTFSNQTGVTASLSTTANQLVLTAVDGRNIQLAADGGTTSIVAAANAFNTTTTGTVTLRSNEAIDIAGNDPASLGFTAGAVDANTVSALQETAGTAASMEITITATDGSANYDTVAGEFQINNVDIIFTSVDNDYAGTRDSLIAAINAVTEQTGVTATENSSGDGIDLSTGFGNSIVVTSTPANNGDSAVLGVTGGTADILGANTATAANNTVSASNTSTTFTSMADGDLTINGYTVDFSNAATLVNTDNERSTVSPTASAQFIALAINNTTGLSDQMVATAYTEMNLGEVQVGDADDQFTMIVNGMVIDIDGPVSSGDSNGNITGTLNGAFAQAASLYASDPTTYASYADAAGLLAKINDSGELVLSAEDGRNITVAVGGTSNTDDLFSHFNITEANSVSSKGTVALEANNGFSVDEIGGDRRSLAGISDSEKAVADINISTQDGAQEAIAVLDRALDQINEARGDLGAANNRLDFTVSNLMNVAENTQTARSRIMDADFAAETSMLSRAQVLQQASQAMLAQANALPQQVLRLLQ